MGYLCANFGLHRPLYIGLGQMYATDRPQTKALLNAPAYSSMYATDRRQTDDRQKHPLMPPPIRGGGIKGAALTDCEVLTALRKWVTSPTPRPFMAICEQELPAVCQYTKFEERSFIRDEDMAHFPYKD